ncbi:hypothetical protein SH2C18_26120 [Clostridium sediminicola]|uniref:hypothetical protein n=1 Tax=Clostridium sediminicola TaxID=3114879 RepID=UPI0031F1E906
MGYSLIGEKEVLRLKEILLNSGMIEPVTYRSEVLDVKLELDGVSTTDESEHFKDMQEVYFMQNDDSKVLDIKGKKEELYYNIGNWKTKSRLPGVHFCVGCKTFGSHFFGLDLSQNLIDDEYIYIVKNISRFGGQGSLARLYRGLKSDKTRKNERKEILIDKFNSEIIEYNENRWICLSKIKIIDIYDNTKEENIFKQYIANVIKFSFIVEDISLSK